MPPLEYNFLLVDDNHADVMVFNEAFQSISPFIKITTLINGKDLMTHLHQNPNNLPDVLFININLPFKNGIDCLKEIKKNELLKRLDVIIYTTYLLPEMFIFLYEQGASFVLIKPTIFVELKRSLKNIVEILIKTMPNKNLN